MPITLTSVLHATTLGVDTIIDARSPSEFAEDHLPGAINLPVLDDAERARVGTIYKQQSPFLARKVGAALVARNVAAHLDGPLADMPGGWRPVVYCWRGGQRSGSFATILGQVGWRVDTIEGGYKAWRRLVVDQVQDQPLLSRVVVLDGNTGTAKTELLALMAARGAQVIDLEGMANHRGSLFGQMPGGQPPQKAFESALGVAAGGAGSLAPPGGRGGIEQDRAAGPAQTALGRDLQRPARPGAGPAEGPRGLSGARLWRPDRRWCGALRR